MTCERPQPRFAYLAPLRNQAKDVAWEYLKHYAMVVPGTTANEAELRVDFPNEGRVRLYGADNPDALRGIYLDGVVLDEYAQMRGFALAEVLWPCLAERKGWAAFIGTPMGRNSFCEMYEKGLKEPKDWHTFMLKASETGLLDAEALDQLRSSMSPDQYQQELECSFDAAIVGSYYGSLMQDLKLRDRITKVDWEPDLLVDTAWDLGIGDSTAIWFAQRIGNEVRLIDYYETSGVGLTHYVEEIQKRKARGWVFGEHVLPHDADVSELGTGRTRVATLQGLKLDPRVLPRGAIDDGINAARILMPKCYFDADRCARGIEALRQYRREYDDKLKAFRQRPLHDWCSHGADAFRYLAVGISDQMGIKIKTDAYAPNKKRYTTTWMSA